MCHPLRKRNGPSSLPATRALGRSGAPAIGHQIHQSQRLGRCAVQPIDSAGHLAFSRAGLRFSGSSRRARLLGATRREASNDGASAGKARGDVRLLQRWQRESRQPPPSNFSAAALPGRPPLFFFDLHARKCRLARRAAIRTGQVQQAQRRCNRHHQRGSQDVTGDAQGASSLLASAKPSPSCTATPTSAASPKPGAPPTLS